MAKLFDMPTRLTVSYAPSRMIRHLQKLGMLPANFIKRLAH
jgi:hypothetical protein